MERLYDSMGGPGLVRAEVSQAHNAEAESYNQEMDCTHQRLDQVKYVVEVHILTLVICNSDSLSCLTIYLLLNNGLGQLHNLEL